MSRRFNRESNLKILQRLAQEERDKQERVDKLVKKFKKKAKSKEFVSDCENKYEICESRLKRKKI